MSEHSIDYSEALPEDEAETTSITFWQDPYAILPAEIDDLEDELRAGFGIDVWEDERQGSLVYEVDCPTKDLEAVSQMMREKGYWFMIPWRRITYCMADLLIEQARDELADI